MKKISYSLLTIFVIISFTACPNRTKSHKHLVNDTTYNGYYKNNLSETTLFDCLLAEDIYRFHIDKWLQIVGYIDSLQVKNDKTDSLLSSLAVMSQDSLNYYYNSRQYHEAIPFAELLILIQKALIGTETPQYATSIQNLGFLYHQTNNYYNAEKFYLKALSIWENVSGETNSNFVFLLGNLGDIYEQRYEYTKAEEYYLTALNTQNSISGKEDLDYAYYLSKLACLYDEINFFEKSEYYYLESLVLVTSILGDFHPIRATTMVNLGVLYLHMGRFQKAERYFCSGLDIQRRIFGVDNIDYALSINNIGVYYYQVGNYIKAEECFLDALRVFKQTKSQHAIECLNNLGCIYADRGEYVKAEKSHVDAMKLVKLFYSENHAKIAETLSHLGDVYLLMRNYDKSEQCYRKSLKICKSKETNSLYLGTLNALGILYGNMGVYSKAEKYFIQVLHKRKQVLGMYHPDYSLSLNNLGTLHHQKGNYEKATQYFLEAADINRRLFIQSINYMSEEQRGHYWDVMRWSFTVLHPYVAFLYTKHWKVISTFAYDNELFVKGLLLNSSESVKRSILESNDTTLINQWNELTTRKQQIQVLQEKEPQSDYLKQIQEEAEQLEKQITQSSAAYRENQAMWQITWDSVRNHLSHNEVAIEYFSAPLSEDSTMYCALFLRNDSECPELISLFEEKEITSFLSAESGNITNKTYDFYANGDTISQLVWSKILPHVKDGETIYFAPSGLLHQLAIEYLPCDENRTMSDVYNMVRLSSTREIVTNKSQADYTTATIYGGIQYDLDADNLLAESERYAKEDLLASRSIENDTLNRGNVQYLPGTKKEAETINTLLKENKITAKLYTSSKANEESFKSLSGKHNNIIHIGTHGFTWTDSTARKQDYFTQRMQLQTLDGSNRLATPTIDPLTRCGLLFAGSNIALSGHSNELPDGVQDGILTAKEISLMDLRDADLVVLSACETAKGDITSEGVFGLQRAFKMAGVQTIIMSLWKVNDQATQLLMTEFYNNWISKHQSKREAFRNAQNTVRTKYEEPEYWAGFIMLD